MIWPARGLDEAGRERRCAGSRPGKSPNTSFPWRRPIFAACCARTPICHKVMTETEGGAKWFTLDEVLRLRALFRHRRGGRTAITCPIGPLPYPPRCWRWRISKAGSAKPRRQPISPCPPRWTATSVLVVDLDSQGSMTSIFGGRIADEWQTAFPHAGPPLTASILRAENQARLDRGEAPLPLEDTVLPRRWSCPPPDIAQKTHWPNIDLIGAQLDLYWAEFQVPVWRMAARSPGSSGTRSQNVWRPTGCCRCL